MKKVGKEVLFISTSEANPRNGEGSFLRMKDGSIMYAYTEYYGDCAKDHGIARISARFSYDDGESWSDKTVLIEKDEKAQNIMSVSLLRLNNGDLGIIYLRKEINEQNGLYCMPVFRFSKDEGKTFSDIQYCTENFGYYCPFNSTAMILKSGRIVYPVSYNMKQYDVYKTGIDQGVPECGSFVQLLYSDDNGNTWNTMNHNFITPYENKSGFTEPSIYEHENGDLWVWTRTQYGHQYQSHSKDGGQTWTPMEPNLFFTSPDSPMQIKKVGKYTVAIFNPIPFYAGNPLVESWNAPKRTPLCIAVSTNDGLEFSYTDTYSTKKLMELSNTLLFNIEDDPKESFCYPAIFEGDNYLLVAYYHSGGTSYCLNCGKIVKITFDELS